MSVDCELKSQEPQPIESMCVSLSSNNEPVASILNEDEFELDVIKDGDEKKDDDNHNNDGNNEEDNNDKDDDVANDDEDNNDEEENNKDDKNDKNDKDDDKNVIDNDNIVDDLENRKAAFKKFIKGIPRTCSPTVCGTIRCPSPVNSNKVDLDESEEWHTKEFNWSIDQIAILQPCDISVDEKFNGELTGLMDSSLERENEQFFEQLEILPSPAFQKLNLTPGDDTGSNVTPFTRLPSGNRSTPYQLFTPPTTRSSSRTVRFSSASSSTPYNNIRTRNKKKLFNDSQDDILEDSESN